MFKRILMTVCAALLLTVNVASAQDYKYFSLDLPAGWTTVDGPSEDADGVFSVIFAKEDKSVAVAVVVSPTDGEDAKAVAEALAPSLGASAAPVAHEDQYGFPYVSKGNQGFAFVAADTKQKLFFVLTVTGDLAQASPVVEGMKSAKYPQLMIK